MDRINTPLPQVPPPAYHQNPFEDPANEVVHDARPVDQFQIINHNAQQAARNGRLRTRGMRDVGVATVFSAASTGLAVLGANLLGQGNLIGMISAGASVLEEALAIQRIRNNPATTPNVALRQGTFSVGGTIFGATAGLIIGLATTSTSNPSALSWGAFGIDLGVAVLWEGVGFVVGRRGVQANTAGHVDDNAVILGA